MFKGRTTSALSRGRTTLGASGLGLTLLVSLAAAMPSTASACVAGDPGVVFPSCFEGGDGNLVVNGAGNSDWASFAPATIAVSQDSAPDTEFGGGNNGKEQDPDNWTLITGNNQPKVDMTAAATRLDPVSNNLFLYGAFHRIGTSGDANLSFELNQAAKDDPFTNAQHQAVPRRTWGDVLITFDGGSDPRIGLCHWYGTARGESENPDFGWYTGPPTDNPMTKTGTKISGNTDCAALAKGSVAVGGMNVAGPVSNPGTIPQFDDPMAASSFGEISVNLTAALKTLLDANPCLDFGSFWLHSRSSTSAVSQMADYIEPQNLIGKKNCGLSVDKRVAVNGGAYHEGTDADPSWANDGDTLNYSLAVTNTGTQTITLTSIADPKCGPATLAPGDRRDASGAVDSTPATFDAGDVWTYRCSHVLAAGEGEPYVNTVDVTGTVGNQTFKGSDTAKTGRYGRINILKDQVGGSDADAFAFTSPLDPSGHFSLSEATSPKTFGNLLPGTYPVGEDALPPGSDYERGGVSCTAGGTADAANHSASVTITPGAVVTCTFVNTKTTLTVVKQVENTHGGAAVPSDFTMHVNGSGPAPASFPGDSAGTPVVLHPVTTPGGYTVSETGPDGYMPTSTAGCASTPVPGSHATCTIVNRDEAATLIVKKVVDNNGIGNAVPGDFTLHVGPAGQASPATFPGDAAGTHVAVLPGHYVVGEDPDGAWKTTYSGDCDATIALGETKTCTVTNTRKVGTIEVVKRLIPADDTGTFDLQVDGTAKTPAPVGDGGTTGAVIVAAGTHTVGEAGAPGVSLGDYVSSVACVRNGAPAEGATGPGPLTVAVGDGDRVVCTIGNTRKATVVIENLTDPAETQAPLTSFGFTSTLPGGNFALVHAGTHSETVAPGTATVSETDPHPLGYRLDGLVCAESKAANTTADLGARTASIAADPGETVRCTFRNTRIDSQAVVVKSGPASAYHGDSVTYAFVVTAVGNSALHDVHVTDDRCSPVSANPVSRANDDGDGLLEPIGADGTTPERWTYSCTMTVPAHVAGETDPVINTATVKAVDEAGRARTATAQHSTDLLHQALALSKSGPAGVVIGGKPIAWKLVLSNTGDTAFPLAGLALMDLRCDSAPVRSGVNGDTTPDVLDPGDRWDYACSTATRADGTTRVLENVATVGGNDVNGRHAVADAKAVASIVYAISASFRAVHKCPDASPRTQRLTVTGLNIASVTFKVNGKLLKRVTKPSTALKDGRTVWRASFVTARQLAKYRVVALVSYRSATGAKPTTLTRTWAFSCVTPTG